MMLLYIQERIWQILFMPYNVMLLIVEQKLMMNKYFYVKLIKYQYLVEVKKKKNLKINS